MLRRNPQTGAWERKVGEDWVPAASPGQVATQESSALDAALGDTFGAPDEPSVPTTPEPGTNGVQAPSLAPSGGAQGVELPSVPDLDPAVGPDRSADSGGDSDLVADIPGLVSGDGARGVSGARKLRERLQGAAARNKQAQGRKTQSVAVGPRSARPVGPAVKDTTEARQTRTLRKTVTVGQSKQRYVNRPAPEVLGKQPKWVQELFEAHFRSDHTLGLRRAFNRMKISRTDYAIGWMTLFEKLREDPSVLRLKDAKDGKA